MSRLAKLLTCALVTVLTACAGGPRDELAVAREASGWRPLLLADVAADMPGPPPAPDSPEDLADLAAVRAWEVRLVTPAAEADRQALSRWLAEDPARAWGAEARRLAGTVDLADPVRAAQAIAYTQAAAYDAILAVWAAKRRYARPGPEYRTRSASPTPGLPSYPSEHAAVAVACAGVLAHLFPEATAGLAARSAAVAEMPVAAGFAYPTDLTAGRAIGERVAAAAIARARIDAAAPTPPATGPWHDPWPLSPQAGGWQPWVLAAASDVAPASPAPLADPAFQAELAKAVRRNATISIKMRAIALKWHEVDMARHWSERAAALVGRYRLPAPEAARVMAYTGLALADAAIAAWHAQYASGRPRPVQLDRRIVTVIETPGHPGYPADGAAMALAAAGYLQAAFPSEAESLRAEGIEASEAGLFAGWHLDSDLAAGRTLGEAVAVRVVARAREDGRP